MASSVLRRQFPELRARALLDAQAEASALLLAARDEAERIRRAAEEEYDTWRAQAVREAEEQVAAEHDAAQLAALSRESRALARLRQGTVPLVLRATEKLVRGAFDARPELVVGVVQEAIDQLRLATALEIEVHPDDLGLLEAWSRQPQHGRSITLRPVNDLARGECRVSSDVGAVDARFSAQLGALEAALRGDGP